MKRQADPMETKTDNVTEITLLWTAAQPSVMAFVRSVTPQLADAEDILQETARQIVTHFDRYDKERPFAPWAMGIARYKVMEWRRRKSRRELPFDEEAIEAIHHAYAERAEDWPRVRNAIDRCMKEAPEASKRLLVLRYIENLKPAEIARRLESTANSVSVRLSRARDRLRECVRRRLHPNVV
jgi:RNA polymerase sigma-70 factor (ECF subfamily)